MPLNNEQVRTLKPMSRSYRKTDAGGLYLEVFPSGSKLWRWKYRYAHKEKRLALGQYPQVKLSEARALRDDAKLQLRNGIDPLAERKRAKAKRALGAANTFAAVAREYNSKREKEGIAAATATKARWFLSLLQPTIGALPVHEIDAQLLLAPLKQLERRGQHETAKKVRSFASRVFRYAVATGRASSDPAALLIGALVAPQPQHRAAILKPGELAKFLRAADAYKSPATRLALKLLPHVFLRPGELRLATWEEVDFDNRVWTIPAQRTKMRKPHRVPLSGEVACILKELSQITGSTSYLFPASTNRRRPMSENTLNGALRRMGFSKDEATAHGFRATASTMLNESGLFNPDAIERALAHGPADVVRAAYHRGDHWDERVAIARWWSASLCELQRNG